MAGMTRRQVLKSAGVAAAVTTSPWWRVGKSAAQRAKKLVFWHLPNFTPLADELQKQQVYEFAKQAGLKEGDVEYAVVAGEQAQQKLAAAIEAGNPPDVMRLYESNVQFYASGGHLLDVNDLVDKMRREPKGIFESALSSVIYKGRAMGVPLAVNPWPVHARLDLLRSEEHTSELQSQSNLVCRLLLEKKKKQNTIDDRPDDLDQSASNLPHTHRL